jgi:hypothetical protein
MTEMRVLLICSLFAILIATPTRADTIYTYTGNPFNEFRGAAACPPLCSISGSFTVEQPLPSNFLLLAPLPPLSFSFTNGSTTITQSDPHDEFFVGTDSHGDISSWVFLLVSQGVADIFTTTFGTATHIPADFTCQGNPCSGFAAVNDNPGAWSVSTVPEPSSLILLGTGVLSLAGAWRWKRFA